MTNEITADELSTILILIYFFSILSLLSSILVIFIYCYFKEQRTFYHELILWFSITNALYNLTAFLPYNGEIIDFWCGLQSYTITWFQDAGYTWSALIGYTGFINVIRRDYFETKRGKFRVIFLLISFGVPGLISSM
jgi:hypothetical protein